MEKEQNTFTVVNDAGEEVICEVLFTFESDETKKNYIVYTDNTLDKDKNIKVYASIFNPDKENSPLTPITSEKEWEVIQNILKSLQEK
ncbi:MAG: DUF1292 domain-containing protein [Bacilli bacterium]|nr:DUF1292 domain-containing protein [Bacilli bacterium]